MIEHLIITIDGPAGAGKSSASKKLASRLGLNYLDTGALYRAIAFFLNRNGILPKDTEQLQELVSAIPVKLESGRVFVDGEDVTALIRSPAVDVIVSDYSALRSVREALLNLQREQARHGSLVAEGRDVGSVVFPSASLKFFMTASQQARADRRYLELQNKGISVKREEILEQIQERDRIDSSREIAPLTVPEGAVYIDTSGMSEDEVVEHLAFLVKSFTEGETAV